MTKTAFEINPIRDDWGVINGAEARDETSHTLLATAKQTAMEGDLLVVEETQFSPQGAVTYKGKLFFAPGGGLAREEQIEGQKKWHVFEHWHW